MLQTWTRVVLNVADLLRSLGQCQDENIKQKWFPSEPQVTQAHVSRKKQTINSWKSQALCDSVLIYERNR